MATKKKATKKKATATKKKAAKTRESAEGVLKRLARRLRKLPYYDEDQWQLLERDLTEVMPSLDSELESIFATRVHGRPPFTAHAMLVVLRELITVPRKPESVRPPERVESPLIVKSDLVLRGHVHNRSVIAALGDITIEGNYVATPDYPCLFSGGTIRCKNYYASSAMTIAVDAIEVEGLMYLEHNHTITISKQTKAGVLVRDDAGIDGKIRAGRELESPGFDEHAALLGDDLYEQLAEVTSEVLLSRLLSRDDVLD